MTEDEKREIELDCPLCQLEQVTHWHYAGTFFIVSRCKTCRVPMYVWRSHEWPNDAQQQEMFQDAAKRFPTLKVDLQMRSLPEHFHFHMRKE